MDDKGVKTTDDTPIHYVRITSGGKIKLWVEFCLNHFRENPGKPLTLHTLPSHISPATLSTLPTHTKSNEEDAKSASEDHDVPKAASASARNIPRLISVVEIIKREYAKASVLGPEGQATGLHQYNRLGFLEERMSQSDAESSDEAVRRERIAAALEGRNFLGQEKTPYMQITLCTNAIHALEDRTTWQQPSVRKTSRSARVRRRRRALKDAAEKRTEGS